MSAHLRAPAHPTSARTATALYAHARHSLALGLHNTLHSPPFVSFPGRSQCELSNEVRSAFGRAEFPFENRLNVPKIAHFFRCAKLKTTCSKNHLAHVQGTPDCGFSHLFAAWLTDLNGTVRDNRFPRHETNDDPTCSFAVTTRNGSRGMAREVRSMCARVYTGTCTSRCEWPRSDRQADTSLLVHGRNWTLSFEDWHALNPEKVFPNDTNAPLVAGQFLFKRTRAELILMLCSSRWEFGKPLP